MLQISASHEENSNHQQAVTELLLARSHHKCLSFQLKIGRHALTLGKNIYRKNLLQMRINLSRNRAQ